MVSLVISAIFIIFVISKILPPRGVEQITTDQLRPLLQKKDVQLIDVRKDHEFYEHHIPGFKNIPLQEIRKEANTLSKDKKTIVICRTGARGNEACKRLKRQGFTDLANVRGGLSTWH